MGRELLPACMNLATLRLGLDIDAPGVSLVTHNYHRRGRHIQGDIDRSELADRHVDAFVNSCDEALTSRRQLVCPRWEGSPTA